MCEPAPRVIYVHPAIPAAARLAVDAAETTTAPAHLSA